MTTSCFRLINGEELISSFEKVNDSYTLKKPAIIMVTPDARGNPNVGLADYLMFANVKNITIHESKILFTYEPETQLFNAYNKMFGSGLVIPSNIGNLADTNILDFMKK